MNSKMLLSALLTSGIFIACTTKVTKSEVNPTSPEAKQVATEEKASHVTEFSFPKGSATLNEAAKSDLRKVIYEAKKSGKIKELKVITWSDTAYPAAGTKKLSSADIDLVKKRNNAISDYVKNYSDGIDVDTYSMAERPGRLEELFNTSDARIKKSMQDAGIATTDSATKGSSNTSKSVIMVITE